MAASTILFTLALYGTTEGQSQSYSSAVSNTFSSAARNVILGYGFINPPPPPYAGGGASGNPATQTCARAPAFCNKSRYRSFDGSCNNLQNPTWGMPETPYARLTSYKYSDGVHRMPRSVTGGPLPNVRELSYLIFIDKPLVDPIWNLNTQQWGQIITHDMSMSAAPPPSNSRLVCCDTNGQLGSDVITDPSCAPVLFPPQDPIHSRVGEMCQNFLRTGTTRDRGCTPLNAPAEPLTSVTAFMDMSIVYGNSADQANSLRTGFGGRMITVVRNGAEWPPQDPNVTLACSGARSPSEPCYLTGDIRNNQNPQLNMLHVMLLREHNRIADNLRFLNPHWNDETIFQEARRILIAEMQHINYYEYLPILLGYDNMVQNKLIHPDNKGRYVNDYSPTVDPTVLNEHASAAFRHFHTLIRGYMKLIKENRQSTGTIRMSDWLERPLILEVKDSFAKLARGLTTQEMGFSDQYWDSELTKYFFRGNNTYGGDLRATDIQRGRDHGLGSYLATRAACELRVPRTFRDMTDFISKENVAILERLYVSPEDVDLVVAGSLERNVPGAMAGPTFLCILTEQFYRTRCGDSHFYENGKDKTTAFTIAQLDEIRFATMARIMCDNVDGIKRMQPRAFELLSEKNKLQLCDDLPFVDLTLWQEERSIFSF